MKIGYLMQLGVGDIRKPPYSGPANHVRQVFQELNNRGHKVRLLFRSEGKTWKTDDLINYEPVIVSLIDRGLIHLGESLIRRIQNELQLPYFSLFDSLRFALACHQELKGYDLLYERLSWVGYGGGIAARWLHIPWVLEENGNPLLMMDMIGNAPRGFQRRLEIGLMNKAVKLAAHIVASGDGWREHFIERFGFDENKVSTVENGTDLINLLPREQLRSFNECENGDGVTKLVYLGGFYPWHGIQILLKAFVRALNQGAIIKLMLIGSGSGLEQAKQLVNELKLSDSVIFTGQLLPNAYAPLLAEADIGLSPYCGWVEYSGLKVIDYKAAGLTTIASGENGKPATLEHGRTGWIVPPCDEDALFNAIVYLSSNPDLRRRISQQARVEAENRHGWKHTVVQLENIFNSVIKSQSSET